MPAALIREETMRAILESVEADIENFKPYLNTIHIDDGLCGTTELERLPQQIVEAFEALSPGNLACAQEAIAFWSPLIRAGKIKTPRAGFWSSPLGTFSASGTPENFASALQKGLLVIAFGRVWKLHKPGGRSHKKFFAFYGCCLLYMSALAGARFPLEKPFLRTTSVALQYAGRNNGMSYATYVKHGPRRGFMNVLVIDGPLIDGAIATAADLCTLPDLCGCVGTLLRPDGSTVEYWAMRNGDSVAFAFAERDLAFAA